MDLFMRRVWDESFRLAHLTVFCVVSPYGIDHVRV